MSGQIYIAAVEHTEADCPLRQPTSEAARTLAANLDEAPAIGVFSPELHQGVVLMTAGKAREVEEALRQVLPGHDIRVKLAQIGLRLARYINQPSLLEDEKERHWLLTAACVNFGQHGFKRTEEENRPSISLRSLPAFLRENAPRATGSAE